MSETFKRKELTKALLRATAPLAAQLMKVVTAS